MTVIGEGTYGCVHKPSLICNKKNITYKNKVSKILSKKSASKEINEYSAISKADKKKEFYLGLPTKCNISRIESNIKSIQHCKDGKEFLEDLDNFVLLIMEYGGENLSDYAKRMKKLDATSENIRKIELFWLEAHRILIGIKRFLDNDLIHHDLKPQNIVYSESQNRANFIDFGLMQSKKKTIQSCKKSKNWMESAHWSFPFEVHFLNKNKYMNFAKRSDNEKKEYYKRLIEQFNKKNEDYREIKAMSIFFTYVLNEDQKKYDELLKDKYFHDYYETLMYEIKPENYPNFLEKSVNTIDLYGTGIAFMYLLNECKHFIKKPLYEDLLDMFYYILTPNISKRLTIDEAINRYEEILSNNGILEKYNKHFENHVLLDGKSVPDMINKKVKEIKTENATIPKTLLETEAKTHHDPCPKNYTYSNSKKKCVKKYTQKNK